MHLEKSLVCPLASSGHRTVEDAEREVVRDSSYSQETSKKAVADSKSVIRFAHVRTARSTLVPKMSHLITGVRSNSPKAPKI
jgi:hypothetical protein